MRVSLKQLILILTFCVFKSCDYTQYPQGKLLYEANCANCHMEDASGVNLLYPALNTLTPTLMDAMPCIIRKGINKDSTALEMLAIPHLSDIEINNIINYLSKDLNRSNNEQSISSTREKLKICE